MAKYRALFVEESREHLSELSRLLVLLESSEDKTPIIDEVFRHAHSIKGMAGSMGYEPISTLAHRMEDVVDARRQGNKVFSKDSIDCLLRAVDALVEQVECVANERPVTEHAALVSELLRHIHSDAQSEARSEPVTKSAASVVHAEARVIRVKISDSASSPAVRAFLVHRRLAELGPILESSPTVEELKRGQMPGLEIRFVMQSLDEAQAARLLASVPDVVDVTFDVAGSGTEAPAAKVASTSKAAEPEAAPKGVSTVRVRTDVLDGLIDSVGELFIARERLQSLLSDATRPELRAALDHLSTRIREIHDQVMAVRMMPMRTLTDRYPRLVRDLSRSLGKDVELAVVGGEIELDRAIIDNLDALFIHTLRNAVDHGIEDGAARGRVSKSATGKITITAQRDRDMVLVVIEDDGRGLDAEKLKTAAVKKGLIAQEAADAMSARDAYFLICLPGFSTKAEVSDVSGRGVGMDAVRSKIEDLGGSLDIESELGRGTRFVFRLPLTLAIIPVLLVEAARRVFAVPVAKVVAVREKGDDVIRQAGGAFYLSFRHALVPVVELARLLDLESRTLSEQVVVIEDGRDLSALGVSRIVGYHEVVVKPLGEPLDRLAWFSGAAILGDGQPILILDVPKALRARTAERAA